MIVLRKGITVLFGALALAAALGGAATPAQAAGKTLRVGVYGPDCPYSNLYSSDIQTAIEASPQPKTIIVCPGGYDPINIDGKQNLKLIAKGAAGIIPPDEDYVGPLVSVHNSTNITIQGFFVDGDEAFGDGGGMGIWYDESSGNIVKNHVLRIRETPIDTYSPEDYVGILVTGTGGQKVKVISNTVQDFEWNGIIASGNVNVQVVKNRVTYGVFELFGPCLCGGPVGILFDNAAAGSIKGNIVQSNFSAFNNSVFPFNFSYGIIVYQSSKIAVSRNSISSVGMGIYVLDEGANSSSLGASYNRVSGNKITDSLIGISVEANDEDGTALMDPHVDHNRITGNKVVSNDLMMFGGIGLALYDDPDDDPIHPTAIGDIIAGNSVLGALFGEPYYVDPGAVDVVFKGNKDGLPKAGAAPAQAYDLSALPRPHLFSAH